MAEWIPAALSIAGSLFGAEGASDSADAARENAQLNATEKAFEAEQLRQQAGQAIATGQRAGIEQQRQARLVQSRTLAVAAAGGGGVSDPTIVNILARTAGEGAYRANVALYGGEEKARQLRMQAAAADYEGAAGIQGGEAKAQAYETTGAATLFSGAASLFGKYNAGGLFKSTVPGFGGPTSAGTPDFAGVG